MVRVTCGVLRRSAKHELHEVGRLKPCAWRHPAKHETPAHLRRGRGCFGGDENDELVERDPRENGPPVIDDAQSRDPAHVRRCHPRDVRRIPSERGRARKPVERERGRVPQVPVRGDIDGEGSRGAAELDASRARPDTDGRDELNAVEVAARRERSVGTVAERRCYPNARCRKRSRCAEPDEPGTGSSAEPNDGPSVVDSS